MILGKMTVEVEQINGRPKWIFCRPKNYADGTVFDNIIGVAHVIYLEKCSLTEDLQVGNRYTFYGIFDKLPSNEQMDEGYILSHFSPVSVEIFNDLLQLYPQEDHRFLP